MSDVMFAISILISGILFSEIVAITYLSEIRDEIRKIRKLLERKDDDK